MYGKKIDNLDVCLLDNINLDIDSPSPNPTSNIESHMSESESIVINYPQPNMEVSKHIINNGPCVTMKRKWTSPKKIKFVNQIISCSEPDFNIGDNSEPEIGDEARDETSDENEKDGLLARKRSDSNDSKAIGKHSSYVDLSNFEEFDYLDDREIIDDYVVLEDLIEIQKKSQENFYKIFYETEEPAEIKKSSNYNNECFCHYCKNNLILPNYEIINFLDSHLLLGKNPKYLLLVFRLSPNIFSNYNVMDNKHLRKYIINYLNIVEEQKPKSDSPELSKFNNLRDMIILNQYLLKIKPSFNSHIYEVLFHQPNLKYTDYVKCDSCKNYQCPKHAYLSNNYYAKCRICKEKSWTICGWCKPGFIEEIACKYLH
jgi:hypothetical protein